MAKQGRRPQPKKVLDMRGSWRGKTAMPRVEDVGVTGAVTTVPDPPKWLTPPMRVYWSQVGQKLTNTGMLSDLTAMLLARYCVALVRWADAQVWLSANDNGTLVSTSGYVYAHPYVTLAKNLGTELLRLEQELGITPASARSLGIPMQKEMTDASQAVDAKARFFRKA